jgi:hypothetical protein
MMGLNGKKNIIPEPRTKEPKPIWPQAYKQNKPVKKTKPIKTPVPSSVTQQTKKLGMMNFSGANKWFNGINGKSKYVFAAAGGVAALTAGGVTLNSMGGSKNSPITSGVMMAGVSAGVAAGAKYGSRQLLKGGYSNTPMSKGMSTSLDILSKTKIGKTAAIVGGGMAVFGLGRKLTGI